MSPLAKPPESNLREPKRQRTSDHLCWLLLVDNYLLLVPVAVVAVPAQIPDSLLAVAVAVGIVAAYAGYFHC